MIGPDGKFQCREPQHNGATRTRTRRQVRGRRRSLFSTASTGSGSGSGSGSESLNPPKRFLSGSHKPPRRFLVIGGNGAGIGNFLIFFPAAYYFAGN